MLPLWLGFLLLIVLLLALDLGVFHRGSKELGLKDATLWTAIWIGLGLAFTFVIHLVYDDHWFGAALARDPAHPLAEPPDAALQYLTAYLLEKSLSVDNIFVIALVFESFAVPESYRRRVLFWGIVGAIVLRAALITSGLWLVAHIPWIFYVFGAWLAFTGVKLLLPQAGEIDPERGLFVRLARRALPMARQDHGEHFMAREGGKLVFTRLSLALLAVEGTDLVFALDSVPAVLAISTDSFIVFTSNIFAILGLRSLYFVLQGFLGRFRHLKLALAFVLVFIGVKMLLHSVYKLPNVVSLGVILGAVAVGVLASLLPEGGGRKGGDGGPGGPAEGTAQPSRASEPREHPGGGPQLR